MKSLIGQRGAHLEGLPLRLVKRLIDLPGSRQLIYRTLVRRIGYPALEALDLPADLGLYAHQHLISAPVALLPPASKES